VAWDAAPTDHPADAVGRYTSSLALPPLDEPRATNLAVEHGLCSHLTSLVLVDEEGRALDGLPEMRKVPLAASGMVDTDGFDWIPDKNDLMLDSPRRFSAEPRSRALLSNELGGTRSHSLLIDGVFVPAEMLDRTLSDHTLALRRFGATWGCCVSRGAVPLRANGARARVRSIGSRSFAPSSRAPSR
jgi:hypothetical protein